MAQKKITWIGKYRISTASILGTIELLYIVGILVVLLLDQGDCNLPLRLWTIILVCIFGVHFLMLVVGEIVTPCCSHYTTGMLSIFAASINAILGTFMMVWFVIGNAWYYLADSYCSDDFPKGSILVFVILVVQYCFLGFGCIIGCGLIVKVFTETNKVND